MNEPDREDLLADVLADTAPADFRDALLGETLHHVRRRRRWRQTRRAATGVAAIALLAVLISRIVSLHPPKVTEGSHSYELVRTQPLSAKAIVGTKPLASEQLIESGANVAIIETEASGRIRLIDDNQLLALVAPRPAALVRFGPASAELIFVDGGDENGF